MISFDTEDIPINSNKIKSLFHLSMALVMIWGGLEIDAMLKAYGLPNFHDQTSSMTTVILLMPIYYKSLNIGHKASDLIHASRLIFVAGTALTCIISLAYIGFIHIAPHYMFDNDFQILNMHGIFGFHDLRFKNHPQILFFTQALIVAPLWEELFRGNAQKGLSLILGDNISLVLVAIVFSFIHKSSAIVTFPAFLALGYLVKLNYSWGERVIVHSMINLAFILNLLTFSFGGSELNSRAAMAFSVSLQFILFLYLTLRFYKQFMKKQEINM